MLLAEVFVGQLAEISLNYLMLKSVVRNTYHQTIQMKTAAKLTLHLSEKLSV